MKALIITGTDTDTGKTVLTTALAAYWQKYYPHLTFGIMKPIQTGIGDRELYLRLFSLPQSVSEINPEYFSAPLAPPIAAQREGKEIDLAKIWQTFTGLRDRLDWLFVETLGGLGSPITNELTVADLARDWRLPTVLIVPIRLGAISQAVANVALAKQKNIQLKGIILNCVQPRTKAEIADWSPPNLIASLTQTPILGILPYLDDPTDLAKLAKIAADLNLEQLWKVGSGNFIPPDYLEEKQHLRRAKK